jgi:hypothetical protein
MRIPVCDSKREQDNETSEPPRPHWRILAPWFPPILASLIEGRERGGDPKQNDASYRNGRRQQSSLSILGNAFAGLYFARLRRMS